MASDTIEPGNGVYPVNIAWELALIVAPVRLQPGQALSGTQDTRT